MGPNTRHCLHGMAQRTLADLERATERLCTGNTPPDFAQMLEIIGIIGGAKGRLQVLIEQLEPVVQEG